MTGSTLVARRAGMRQATNDTVLYDERGAEKNGEVQRWHAEENALHHLSRQPGAEQTEDGGG